MRLAAPILGVLVVACGCSSDDPTEADGKAAATQDIAAGKLILRNQNLPSPPGHAEYTNLLRERCGFTFETVRGPLSDADNAYNAAMKSEARRKFGATIFADLEKEADEQYENSKAAPSE